MALDTNAVAPKIRDYISRNFLFSDKGFHYGDDASFLEEGIIKDSRFKCDTKSLVPVVLTLQEGTARVTG